MEELKAAIAKVLAKLADVSGQLAEEMGKPPADAEALALAQAEAEKYRELYTAVEAEADNLVDQIGAAIGE